MLRIFAATLMLLFIAGCTQSTDSTPTPGSNETAAEVPTRADTDSAIIDLANATEVVVTVPGMS